jgi:hypothetical protein
MRSSRARLAGTVTAAIAVSGLYLLFVVRYSTNVLYQDDWSVVPLVHAYLHGNLTLAALWALHNQNRMLVPNLSYVELGALTHDNTSVVTVLSAILFAITFAIFLVSFRSYLGRALKPLTVLVLGGVWFSIIDWQNALWAFQFAWYLILFFLITMIYCLQRRWLALALVVAVLASFSSFQGLALWPVGVIMLMWRGPWWHRRLLIWIGGALVTAVGYFWHYNARSLPTHSPRLMIEFFLVELGEVVPRANALHLHELIGAVILAAAAYVIIQCLRHDRDGLPVALITFGLLFDVFVVAGRAGLPLSVGATQSRYTMPNLIIVVAIVSYACAHLHRVWMFSVLALVAVQFVLTTDSGLASARALDGNLTESARLAVNFNRVPAKESLCYAVAAQYDFGIPDPGYFAIARTDHLSEFSSGSILEYRAAGLPSISFCH